MIACVASQNFRGAVWVRESFGLPRQVWETPGLIRAAKNCSIDVLGRADLDVGRAFKIRELGLSQDPLQFPDVIEAWKAAIAKFGDFKLYDIKGSDT